MAKEPLPSENKPQPAAPVPAPPPSGSWTTRKILMIGGPVIVLQIAIVYLLVAKFIGPKLAANGAPAQTAVNEQKASAEDETTQIVVIKDIIVNPAGTNGTRFLVTTVGLEVPSVEAKAELEQKEVQTRDVLITILSGKRLEDLATPADKDSLRVEIQERIDSILKSAKLRNVYISKFIIQ